MGDTKPYTLNPTEVDAMLVDTEGADSAVLRGSRKTLKTVAWPRDREIYKTFRGLGCRVLGFRV